jgi:hypothetical protein
MPSHKPARECSDDQPDIASLDAVDTDTGEIRRRSAIVPKDNQTWVIAKSRRPVYAKGAFSLITDQLFEVLADSPEIKLQHLRLMMWFLARADYDNEVTFSMRSLEHEGIVNSRTRGRRLLADLQELDLVRIVRSPPNSNRTVMINPALRWRGKRETQRSAVEFWGDLSG